MEISLSRFVESEDEYSSEEKLEVDGIDILVIGINFHGKIEIWNQLAASTTGLPADKAYGKDLYSSLTSNDKFKFKYNLKSIRHILDDAMHGKRPFKESSFLLSTGKAILMSLKLISWHKNPEGLYGAILVGHGFSGVVTKLCTHSQDLVDFINFSDSPLIGFDNSRSNPLQTNGRTTNTCFSFSKPKKNLKKSERLVGEHDPSKENPGQTNVVACAWHDIQSFTNSLDALVFGMDSFGKVNLWNDKSVHVFGCTREEAIGKNFVQVANLPNSKTSPTRGDGLAKQPRPLAPA